MVSCEECIQRLKPDDPRIPIGPYHQSSCDFYCNKPSRERTLEQDIQVKEALPWDSRQWNTVNQLRSMVIYLQEKVNKITDKKAVDKQYTIK